MKYKESTLNGIKTIQMVRYGKYIYKKYNGFSNCIMFDIVGSKIF